MDLSIVSSLYRSAPYLREFHRRVSAAAVRLDLDYEVVLVNDGSPDDSLEIALELRRDDPRLCVVDLSRNFGHHKAMMTGLAHARGNRVFLLDSDLEEDPELMLQFSEVMDATAADVIYGVQPTRKGGYVERASGRLFYRIFNWLSAYEVPANQLTARLMTRRYVDSLTAHRDREIFLAGLWAVTGYRQVAVAASKRSKGVSTYNLRRKLSVALNSVTSFSSRPLEAIFYIGTVILVLSLFATALLTARRLFIGELLPGWASTIVAICFMGGLNLFCVGIVGIYLAKVFGEMKDRPYTVIRDLYPASTAREGEAAASPAVQQ